MRRTARWPFRSGRSSSAPIRMARRFQRRGRKQSRFQQRKAARSNFSARRSAATALYRRRAISFRPVRNAWPKPYGVNIVTAAPSRPATTRPRKRPSDAPPKRWSPPAGLESGGRGYGSSLEGGGQDGTYRDICPQVSRDRQGHPPIGGVLY